MSEPAAAAGPAASARVWRTSGGSAARCARFERVCRFGHRPAHDLSVSADVQASVVFAADGTAFVAAMDGAVHCFTPKGQPRWRLSLDASVVATPVVLPDDATLVAATVAGSVYAIDTAQGRVRWQRQVATRSDPRILSDLLYLPNTDSVVLSGWGGRFVALDTESGQEQRSWDAGIAPRSAAAGDAQGNCYCLRAVAGRGTELLQVNPSGDETVRMMVPESKRGARRAVVVGPVLDEDRGRGYAVFNDDRTSELRAWSLASGQPLDWRHSIPHCVQSAPAVLADGAIALADLGGELRVVNPDASLRWVHPTDGDYFLAGPVADAGGTVLAGDPLGQLHRLSPSGRGEVWFRARRAIQSRPAFDPVGRLFLAGTDRHVHVFEPTA